MSPELTITLAALFAAFGLATWMIVLEHRGPIPGRPRLVPTTPILLVAILVLLLALAHLLTILTGSPHRGGFG